jgi:antitoxin VapB
MTTAFGRTFRYGDSEAVQLPSEVAFGQDIDVTIVRSGEVLTLYPKRPPIGCLIARLAASPQPDSVELRDETPIPERDGL